MGITWLITFGEAGGGFNHGYLELYEGVKLECGRRLV